MYDMVCRDKIIGALAWLKHHNTHYSCISINMDWIPPNDICGYHENMTMTDVDSINGHDIPYDDDPNTRETHTKMYTVPKHTTNASCEQVCTLHDKDCNNQETSILDVSPIDVDKSLHNEMSNDEDKLLDEDQAAVDRRQELTGDDMSSVVQIENIENKIYQCAPGQNNTPQYLQLDDNFEVLTFPDLFPYDLGGYFSSDRMVKMDMCKYLQQRLLNADGRYAQNMEYIFCAQYISDIKQIQSDANMTIHLLQGCTLDGNKITATALHNPHVLQRLV